MSLSFGIAESVALAKGLGSGDALAALKTWGAQEARSWIGGKLEGVGGTGMESFSPWTGESLDKNLDLSRPLADISSEEALGQFSQNIIDKYAEAKGLDHIDVVVTRNVPNACASKGISWIHGDETIYINPDYISENCDSPDKLAGVVLHEAGHIYGEHNGYTANVGKNYADEIEADVFAAQAMESLGFDKMEFAKLAKTFGDASQTHPDGYARYTVIKTTPGFDGRVATLATEPTSMEHVSSLAEDRWTPNTGGTVTGWTGARPTSCYRTMPGGVVIRQPLSLQSRAG